MINRRTALKNLTLGLGAVVTAPTVLSILSSCTAEVETWKPVFFSESQKILVSHLADVIIPSDEIPGALDVNVPQFIDKMINDLETDENKGIFKKGAAIFSDKIGKVSKKNVETGLETYFKLKGDAAEKAKSYQWKAENDVDDHDKNDFYLYKFLFVVRQLTLFGYYTSKKIGTEVLSYDPVPGSYDPCIPLEDVGNTWSLR